MRYHNHEVQPVDSCLSCTIAQNEPSQEILSSTPHTNPINGLTYSKCRIINYKKEKNEKSCTARFPYYYSNTTYSNFIRNITYIAFLYLYLSMSRARVHIRN